MSGTLGFLASNTHLATRNPKFWTEIEPECGKNLFLGLHLNLGAKFRAKIEPVCDEDLFFDLHLNLGTKFRTEIKLFSLTKLRPLGICLINKKSTPMYMSDYLS